MKKVDASRANTVLRSLRDLMQERNVLLNKSNPIKIGKPDKIRQISNSPSGTHIKNLKYSGVKNAQNKYELAAKRVPAVCVDRLFNR